METTDDVVKTLSKVFSHHGSINTDGGSCFINRFTRIMDDLGIIHNKGSAYNHHSQGQVERATSANKTLYARMNKKARSASRLQHAIMSLNSADAGQKLLLGEM